MKRFKNPEIVTIYKCCVALEKLPEEAQLRALAFLVNRKGLRDISDALYYAAQKAMACETERLVKP